MGSAIIVLIIALLAILAVAKPKLKYFRKKTPELSKKERKILRQNVPFYQALSVQEKTHFEVRVQHFLTECMITGVETTVTDTDRMLVGASAIIPVFAFPNWRYVHLDEVLLYPGRINTNFQSDQPDSNILGMVGTGPMERKMALSKPALHHGFANHTDKRNTAIHEFVHLIDKQDGKIDGIPKLLLERPYIVPWLDLMHHEINSITKKKSDINPYGATSHTEFYAVAAEYFFERPQLLAKKHPQLYGLLEEIFDQDLVERNRNKVEAQD